MPINKRPAMRLNQGKKKRINRLVFSIWLSKGRYTVHKKKCTKNNLFTEFCIYNEFSYLLC